MEEDRAQDVLGIYERRGPVWGMGVAGAVLLISALSLIGTLRPAFFDGVFALVMVLSLAGTAFVILAALLYYGERERAAKVRRIIVAKAIEDKDLLTTLVKQFVLRKLPGA